MATVLITPPFQVPFFNKQTADIDQQWKRYLLELTRQIGLAFAPADGSYVVTADVPGLPNEFNLGLLTSGLLKQTVVGATATPAIAIAGTDYTSLAFKTIQVATQSDVVADGASDTLTFAAGAGLAITTNAGTDTITWAATASPSSGGMDAALMLMGG